ncbi:MAG: phage holin family protein [Flavobacterium sp.]
MENSATTIEKLIEKAERYAKTSLELAKYNTVYKSAEIFSSLAVKLTIILIMVIVSLLVNIGLALWIGEVLGASYYGFFIVAGFYLLLALLFLVFRHQWIKKPVSDFIINNTLKEELI